MLVHSSRHDTPQAQPESRAQPKITSSPKLHLNVNRFFLVSIAAFYKDKGQGFIVIAVCKGTKLNNVRQKTKHIYLSPRRFPCFRALSVLRKEERINNYLILKNYLQKDLNFSIYIYIFACCCLVCCFLAMLRQANFTTRQKLSLLVLPFYIRQGLLLLKHFK